MDLFDNIIEKGKSAVDEKNRIREKQKNEYGMKLNVQVGKKMIESNHSSVMMWQQTDGKIYFDDNDSVLYEYLGYQWDGPKYKTVTTGMTSTVGKNTGKVKRSGRLLGALIGVCFNWIGMIIGLFIGTGKKIKGKTKEKSKTKVTEKEKEVSSSATVLLKKYRDGRNINIMVECTSKINNGLSMFVISSGENVK